jgi:hypothetical protein
MKGKKDTVFFYMRQMYRTYDRMYGIERNTRGKMSYGESSYS